MGVGRSPPKWANNQTSSDNSKNMLSVFEDLPLEVRLTKIKVLRTGENLDKATKALLNCILEHRGQKPPGKVHTHSQDKANMKKAYVVDSK